MYIFEAEISSEVLEMLDKPTVRAEHTTWPTVLCRAIPFKPYDNFQLRIMAEVLGDNVSGEIQEGLAETRSPALERPSGKRRYYDANSDFDADSSSEGDRPRVAKRGRRGPSPSPSQTADSSSAEAIKTINTRVDAWRRGEVHSPVSAEQSDSSID